MVVAAPGSCRFEDARPWRTDRFAREFDGRQEDTSYIEISQKLAHAFGLHYVPERSAFCRFDERGDVEDVVRVLRTSGQFGRERGLVVTILRNTLDEYMTITGQTLVLLYDSTRFEPKNFGGWQNQEVAYHEVQPEIYYRMGQNLENASYLRGFKLSVRLYRRKTLSGGMDTANRRREGMLPLLQMTGSTVPYVSARVTLSNWAITSWLPSFRMRHLRHSSAPRSS